MEKISFDYLIKTLRPRLRFLDGVSLSGGEPLLHSNLVDFLKELKFFGSLVRLKTNASRPKAIQLLIDRHLVDFYSIFIPGPFSIYKDIVNYHVNLNDVSLSIQMIRKSGIDHEFRVKAVPGLVEKPELIEIANYLVGAPRFVIERFEPEKSMDESFRELNPFPYKELVEMRDAVAHYFNETILEI